MDVSFKQPGFFYVWQGGFGMYPSKTLIFAFLGMLDTDPLLAQPCTEHDRPNSKTKNSKAASPSTNWNEKPPNARGRGGGLGEGRVREGGLNPTVYSAGRFAY